MEWLFPDYLYKHSGYHFDTTCLSFLHARMHACTHTCTHTHTHTHTRTITNLTDQSGWKKAKTCCFIPFYIVYMCGCFVHVCVCVHVRVCMYLETSLSLSLMLCVCNVLYLYVCITISGVLLMSMVLPVSKSVTLCSLQCIICARVVLRVSLCITDALSTSAMLCVSSCVSDAVYICCQYIYESASIGPQHVEPTLHLWDNTGIIGTLQPKVFMCYVK